MSTRLPKLISKVLPFDTPVQILILSILAVVVVVFLYSQFTQKAEEEGFGALYDSQNRFTESQRSLFHDQINKTVPYNTGLETDMVSRFKQAVNGIDTGINIVKTNNLDKYFEKDPIPGIRAAEAQCNVLEPIDLPARAAGSRVGCGWWYQDDDNKQSSGVRGTQLGPLDSDIDRRSPGGEWIWNAQLAQKKEDAKRCRKIKSCALADLVPNKCGFCLATNIGVPVDAFGRSKYPNDPLISCTSSVITKPGNCPPPPSRAPEVQPDGTVVVPPPERLVCDPMNGRLTLDCLISLAQGAGCQEEGALLNILRGDSMGFYRGRTDNNFKFKKALELLASDGRLRSGNEYFGDGVCDRTDALNYYTKLVSLVRTGSTTRARDAAGFLVNGTDFDPCDYDPAQAGPFDLSCQVRVAREKGCQPDGTAFPQTNNKSTYDNMTWSNFNNFFANLRLATNSDDKDVQADATKKCLGVNIAPVASDCGETAGCEVYWYRWQFEWDLPEKQASRGIFFGRQIRSTLPDFNTGGSNFNPYGQNDSMAMRIRTRLTSPTGQSANMWIMTDDGIAVRVNNRMVLRKWWDQGPTAYVTEQFSLLEKKPTDVDIFFYENGGGATFIPRILLGGGGHQVVPEKMLTMRVPSGFPIARWDFYMGGHQDRNGVLSTQVFGSVPFGSIDGKNCALFRGQMNYVQIQNPISTGAFRSITMMVYINSSPAWPRLWEMNNNGFSGAWCQDNLFGCLSPNLSLGVGFYNMAGCGGPSIWTDNGSISFRKWTHMTWVMDDDMGGMTLYVDGVLLKRLRNDSTRIPNKIFNNFYILQSTERFDKDVGVAWVHMFDYPLSVEEIKMDIGLGFTNTSVYPEDPTSGWTNRFRR